MASTCSTRAPRELKTSQLELVVAGTANAVLMVESEAALLSEEVMLGAVMFGHQQMQAAIKAINELVAEVGVTRWDWKAPASHDAIIAAIEAATGDRLTAAYAVRDKLERRDAISKLKKEVIESLKPQAEANGWPVAELGKEFGELEYNSMRARGAEDPHPHRRPRPGHRAPDLRAYRRAAAHPRFGAVHPRRDPGAGHHHARHRP